MGQIKGGKLFGFRKILLLSFLGLALLSGWGCATGNHLTQTSTIDALLAGVYDGEMSCAELLYHGDFGIGTFNHLDGEMVVLDGTVYQVKVDGRVYQPSKDLKTPFAGVCFFSSDQDVTLEAGLKYADLKILLDELVPSQNLFVAIKIEGLFKYMKVRSVPAQSKPYQPLAKVIENQKVFELEEIAGTIVGFRSPPFVKGINVPGYHCHFLDQELQAGGHILDLETISGICQVDILDIFTLVMPSAAGILAEIDLSKDRSHALEKVER